LLDGLKTIPQVKTWRSSRSSDPMIHNEIRSSRIDLGEGGIIMHGHPTKFLLAGIVALSSCVASAWSGQPPAGTMQTGPATAAAAPYPGSTDYAPYGGLPDEVSPTPPPPRGPIHRCLQKHPVCCYANINTVGCSNLKAECDFVFGSCRRFYGDPCLKPPPKSSYDWRATTPCNCR
jgi:hypothetical protein